jgi:plasmid maintenance system antidote protein VapI
VSTTDPEYERLLAEEKLILDATEMISQLMEEQDVSRAELAKRINRSRGFVTQLLTGDRNMTLRTLADLGLALGAQIQMSAQPTSAATYTTTSQTAGVQIPQVIYSTSWLHSISPTGIGNLKANRAYTFSLPWLNDLSFQAGAALLPTQSEKPQIATEPGTRSFAA